MISTVVVCKCTSSDYTQTSPCVRVGFTLNPARCLFCGSFVFKCIMHIHECVYHYTCVLSLHLRLASLMLTMSTASKPHQIESDGRQFFHVKHDMFFLYLCSCRVLFTV